MAKDNNCLQPIAEILPGIVKPEHKSLTPIQERLVSMPFDDDATAILYQHSVLCQTCMPYRNPGEIASFGVAETAISELNCRRAEYSTPTSTTSWMLACPSAQNHASCSTT